MKNGFYIAVGFMALGLSCAKTEVKKQTPSCIEERIDLFEKTICDKGAKVYEYDFQGQRVYVFDPGFCGPDNTAKVVNKECQEIGTIGGVNGNQDVNGSNFAHAQRVGVIWSKAP